MTISFFDGVCAQASGMYALASSIKPTHTAITVRTISALLLCFIAFSPFSGFLHFQIQHLSSDSPLSSFLRNCRIDNVDNRRTPETKRVRFEHAIRLCRRPHGPGKPAALPYWPGVPDCGPLIDPAVLQHIAAIGDLQGQVHILLDQQNRRVSSDLHDGVEQPCHGLWCNS